MQNLRRWTAGLVSRVDWMVSQVENHEAIAESAIRDVSRSAARAKVQLARVRADGSALKRRQDEAVEAEATWRSRATRAAAEADEPRALECLRRSKRSARQAATLTERLAEHARVETQLAKDVDRVQDRLRHLKEQRNLLRTRQSRAEALVRVRDADAPAVEEIGELFDRWETRVTEREIAADCCDAGESEDGFEETFRTEEEEAELRAELATLTAGDLR